MILEISNGLKDAYDQKEEIQQLKLFKKFPMELLILIDLEIELCLL